MKYSKKEEKKKKFAVIIALILVFAMVLSAIAPALSYIF